MGLRKAHLLYFFEMFELAGYDKFDGLKMCELGNQSIKVSGMEYSKSKNMPPCKTGKELFTRIGFQHTSIDINGKDYALPIDLTKPIQNIELLSYFDVLTNSGTTEHVSDQFECFKNIHNLCKEGGVFIHMVPSVKYRNTSPSGRITSHGLYSYSFDFFHHLAVSCGYKVLDARVIRMLVCVTMQKTNSRPFISKHRFEALPINICE